MPLVIYSQQGNGIYFKQYLSWREVKAAAKAENKYIFIDCFATWCVPCKSMDKNVFTNDTLGAYMNDKFISVKVQMDSNKYDSEEICRWYSDANAIEREFKLQGFPSFLFFTPEGKLIHRGLGYHNVNAFMDLVKLAVDPKRKEYLKELMSYKYGNSNYSNIPELIKISRELFSTNFADSIASDYKINYLDNLDLDKLVSKDKLEFIIANYKMVTSNDKFFYLFYNQPNKVDSILQNIGQSERFVKYIINKEEITDKLFLNDSAIIFKPNWEKINLAISQKYKTSYAEALIPPAKISFYKRMKNWKEFVKLRDRQIKKKPPKVEKVFSPLNSTSLLNSDAWYLFLHCGKRKYLFKALAWIELAIQLEAHNPNIQFLDTRANLLYKLGRVNEAIQQEQKAIDLGIEFAKRNGKTKGYFFDEYSSVITKMKNGEPTWFVKEEKKGQYK